MPVLILSYCSNYFLPKYYIWQRNHYEYVTLNQVDLRHIRAYILANPARWAADRLHPDT
jgi:hypothetical protein